MRQTKQRDREIDTQTVSQTKQRDREIVEQTSPVWSNRWTNRHGQTQRHMLRPTDRPTYASI